MAGSCLVSIATAIAGVSPWVALPVSLVAPGWVIGRDLTSTIREARRSTLMAVSQGHARARRARAHTRLDPISHDPFRDALVVLERHDAPEIISAAGVLRRIERELLTTAGDRDESALGSAFNFHKEGGQLIRYGDPERAPTFLGPLGRDLVVRFGRTLDDVRLLHEYRIERSVMLFTFWGRALLLAVAPTCGGLTFGTVPLSDDASTAANLLWGALTAYSFGLTVFAPGLTALVLDRTERAARARRWLTAVEVPLATVATLAFPAWPVAAFAAGWTNWWQRNSRPPESKAEFSWPRLFVFLLIVAATLAAGLADAGVDFWAAAVEVVVSFAVIGVVGGSYGAMFPLSLAVLVQTLYSAATGPRRAERTLAKEVQDAIDALNTAAFELDDTRNASEPRRMDSQVLRRAADELRLHASADERAAGRTPRRLADLIDLALSDVAPAAGSREAEAQSRWAARTGDEEPISFFHPNLPSGLDQARARDQKTARLLRQLVERCALEARAHGTGAAEFLVVTTQSEIIWRMGNHKRTERRSGRGTGHRQLRDLAERLGAAVTIHESIDSTFVDGTGANEIFGVEIRLPPDVLELGP